MSDGQEGFGTRGGNGHPYKSKPGSQNPLAFHFGGLQNLLKLRTTFKFNERLSGLVGADVNVQQQTAFPVALLQYQVGTLPVPLAQVLHRAQYGSPSSTMSLCRSLVRAGTGAYCKPAPQA